MIYVVNTSVLDKNVDVLHRAAHLCHDAKSVKALHRSRKDPSYVGRARGQAQMQRWTHLDASRQMVIGKKDGV